MPTSEPGLWCANLMLKQGTSKCDPRSIRSLEVDCQISRSISHWWPVRASFVALRFAFDPQGKRIEWSNCLWFYFSEYSGKGVVLIEAKIITVIVSIRRHLQRISGTRSRKLIEVEINSAHLRTHVSLFIPSLNEKSQAFPFEERKNGIFTRHS